MCAMTDALLGVLLIVITGLIWAVIGAFFSHVARHHLRMLAFSMAMTLCVALLSWATICNWPVVLHGGVQRGAHFIPLIALGGILNWCGMLLIMAAMRRGHQAGSWSVSQSAMVMPFLAGIIFWAERPSLPNVAGAAMILLAVALFGLRPAPPGGETRARPWFHIALMAFCIIGISQTLFTAPSHWPGWEDTGRLRVPVLATAALCFLVVVCAIRREWPGRREWRVAALCCLVGYTGNWIFFIGMDMMAKRKLVALVYPLAVGVCMTGFVLYTRLWMKERLGRLGVAALVLDIAGVLLLGLG
jgi:drug/metabolite transporter (DMT)-like permease